jgi:hypothetical protein
VRNGGPDRQPRSAQLRRDEEPYQTTLRGIGVDLTNLLNSNYATAYESNYSYTQPNGGTWHNPTTILAPRFVRLNFTLNY